MSKLLIRSGMSEMSRFAVTRKILEDDLEARIILLTAYNDRRIVEEGFSVGARGFVLKLTADDEYCGAIGSSLTAHRVFVYRSRLGHPFDESALPNKLYLNCVPSLRSLTRWAIIITSSAGSAGLATCVLKPALSARAQFSLPVIDVRAIAGIRCEILTPRSLSSALTRFITA
jgi:CheY-like chemotaxis protein